MGGASTTGVTFGESKVLKVPISLDTSHPTSRNLQPTFSLFAVQNHIYPMGPDDWRWFYWVKKPHPQVSQLPIDDFV